MKHYEIRFLVNETTYNECKKLAERLGIPITYIVRMALKNYLKDSERIFKR